jgi:hypothetical protein
MSCWKALLLIYSSIDVRVRFDSGQADHFRHMMSDQELNDALNSFERFPSLVIDLTGGRAKIEYDIKHSERRLLSLTRMGPDLFWPSPADTKPELDKFAPSGKYASVFVLWPQHDLLRGISIASGGWGLALAASDWSNSATYATVSNTETWRWRIPVIGEVWLHEWLHGACAYFAGSGYRMPDGDADGGGRHGYVQSAVSGWTEYYRDLMSRNVIDRGKLTGIPLNAWEDFNPFLRLS